MPPISPILQVAVDPLPHISPPVFAQPPSDMPPISPVLQVAVDPLPYISLHNTTSDPTEDIHDYPMAQDPLDYPLGENLPDYLTSNPSLLTEGLIMDFSINPELCDSPIDRPPSSTFTSSTFISDTSSAPVSESDLPPPSSPKAKKQTGLFDFFPKIPSEEFHTKWRKRKRENEERDQEEYAKRKQKDEAEKSRKQAHKREKNRISQSKHREKVRKEKDRARLQDSSVSLFCQTLCIGYTYDLLGGIHT